MKFTLSLLAMLFLATSLISARAQTSNEHAVLPVECKIALRLVSSADYVRDHHGEIPDEDKMNENEKAQFVANLFNDIIKKQDNEAEYCTNTIRENLGYTNAYHFPQQCVEFMPLLKKSFEEKTPYTKDFDKSVKVKMDESVIDMLLLDEVAPDKLLRRCEVGIEVMHVDLNDKHLKEKYPLPPACEAFFADMEKTLILPAELTTIKRQRVIFAVENRNTPKKLDEICEQISR